VRLIMIGTGTFAEPPFLSILNSSHQVVGLITQPDRPAGQVRGSTRQLGQGMTAIARTHDVAIFQPDNVNTPEGLAWVKSRQPDLLVVAAYGQILSSEILGAVPSGGINVHASLLPRYRGAAPVAWAIYHGETKTGVTIIKMSVYLDAGDILAQESLDINPTETAGELEARVAILGARLALQVIDQIAVGKAHGTRQDRSQATKAPKLTKEHGLIDWNRHGRDVCNHVRAMQPWPTAYTFRSRPGQAPLRLIISRATWQEQNQDHPHVPGTTLLLPANPSRLFVAAALDSLVEILELQPAGKRRMPAAEFLRGRSLQSGDRLGQEGCSSGTTEPSARILPEG
jgi:methionyl-tRNA formyltransferase